MSQSREVYNSFNISEQYFSPRDIKENFEEEIFLSLPYSDLSEWIYTNDIVYKTLESINLKRLRDVCSLSNLSPLIPGVEISNQFLRIHDHTRESHTLLVANVGVNILERNNFNQKDIQLYTIAAFLHDLATPGYGDSTKFVDLENLHEELFWQEMLDDKSKKYINENNISLEEIDNIIKNKGILGEILDIADRITYVMQDAQKTPFLHPQTEVSDKDMKYIRSVLPQIGNIYKDVVFDKNLQKIYFNNPNHLYDFLLLRSLLHREVYLHPVNQARDMIVAKVIKPHYSSNESLENKLTPKKLRQMNDTQVVEYLASKYNTDYYHLSLLLESWKPEFYSKCHSQFEVEKKCEEIYLSDKFLIGTKECKGFKTSTKYNIKNNLGEIIPFFEYDSNRSDYLQKIADSTKAIYVFYEQNPSEISSIIL